MNYQKHQSIKVTKAVFPVAGFGTRFLPATKASPKEMLPIVDKPLIQYAVEEAIEAGITDMIFVTGRNKRSIEDHFDKAYELESELTNKNKEELLKMVQNVIPSYINCIYIRQPQMLGLGHAVLCAKPVINNEPFAVILADELLDAKPGALAQMMDIYHEVNQSVLGVSEVNHADVGLYGIVKMLNDKEQYSAIQSIIEKPSINQAPSNLAIIGRYILTPNIIDELELLAINNNTNEEIQLTTAIDRLLAKQLIFAYKITATRYDCGSKLGYLKATVHFGLKHQETSIKFKEFLQTLFNQRAP